MSQQALNDFLDHLSSDAAMAEAFGATISNVGATAGFDAVAAFAASKGFDVTPADAEAFYLNQTVGEEGELSDEALENVAGGSFLKYLDPRTYLRIPQRQVQPQ